MSDVKCTHGAAVLRTTTKEGPNKGELPVHARLPCTSVTLPTFHGSGRQFYCCPVPKDKQGGCKFFKWVDEVEKENAKNGNGQTNMRK
jgi:hypothetical protein